jgi:hypothetical protein
MATGKLEDIGAIDSFPSKKKIGKWAYSDLSHGTFDRRLKGERRIYHNQSLVMVISIEHAIAMEFVLIKEEALANYDSLNLIFDRLGVDIRVFQHGMTFNTKWKKIRETEELVEIQRIP